MAKANWFRGSALLVLGAILGGLLVASWEHSTAVAQNNPPVTQATLVADVTHLRDITPPNSHPMVDVARAESRLCRRHRPGRIQSRCDRTGLEHRLRRFRDELTGRSDGGRHLRSSAFP